LLISDLIYFEGTNEVAVKGFVRVSVMIPNLEVKKKVKVGFFKFNVVKEVQNARIETAPFGKTYASMSLSLLFQQQFCYILVVEIIIKNCET